MVTSRRSGAPDGPQAGSGRIHVFRWRSLAVGLIVFALLWLRGFSAAEAPPAAAGDTAVEGTFAMTWGDPAPDLPQMSHQQFFWLFADDGARTDFIVDDATATSGELLRLQGKRVRVQLADSISSDGLDHAITIEAVDGIQNDGISLAGSRRFISILCRFGDSPGITPHTVPWFDALFSNTEPGLDHYWRQASYQQINIEGSQVTGWYNLPNPKAFYINANTAIPPNFTALLNDCTAAADAGVDFSQVEGLNLMFNENIGCCAWGGTSWINLDGYSGPISTTWMPPWGFGSQYVMAHEMGHGFGLPHSSGRYSQTYDSRWDIMSGGGMCSVPDPNYGCIGVHTISFHKDLLGWIDNSKKFVLGAGNTATVSIDRLSDPAPGADYLMAQVPIGESANLYYTVEVRKFFDYDTQVPHSGVLIHEVDLNRGSRTAQVIDVDEGGNPNGPGAILTAGQSFTDDANEITVTVDQETATGSVVTVTLGGAVGPGNDPPPDYPNMVHVPLVYREGTQ